MANELQSDVMLLRPAIRGLANTWLTIVKQELSQHFPGLALTRITETMRTAERQAECFKVAASRFTDSFHCYGMAWDFACFEDSGVYIKNGAHEYYKKCGLVAESLGLVWGGSWVREDWDHIQVAGLTLSQLKAGTSA